MSPYGIVWQRSDHVGLHVIGSYITVVARFSVLACRYSDIAAKSKHAPCAWRSEDGYRTALQYFRKEVVKQSDVYTHPESSWYREREGCLPDFLV